MWTEEKVIQKIKTLEENKNFDIYEYNFIINEKPEQYVRERSGRGKHWYNPKGSIITRYKELMQKQLSKKDRKILKEIFDGFDNGVSDYTLEVECDFYLPIPKNDSVITAAKKEMKEILPNKRPDLDNYGKLLMDAMHDVVYRDDCKVCDLHSKKFYSINPRTEIRIRLKNTKLKEV